jgi:hypothetical protein
LGAGPGPTKRYYVGLPKYEIMGEHLFGGNTPVDLPVKRLIDDAFNAAEPHINEIVRVAGDRANEVIGSQLDRALTEGNVIVERVAWPLVGGMLAIGFVAGMGVGAVIWRRKK